MKIYKGVINKGNVQITNLKTGEVFLSWELAIEDHKKTKV